MKLQDWIARLEQIAPPTLAEEGDNVGLLIGPEQDAVRRVLVALDCSVEVAREAVDGQFDMVLTHHPLFYRPVRHMLPDDPQTAAAYILIRHGIGLYASHTNLDNAAGGVNDVLADVLGLTNPVPFGDGMGRVGTIIKETTLAAFTAFTERTLGVRAQLIGPLDAPVRRVAVLGGSAAFAAKDAKAVGADVFITGDITHHQAHDILALGIPCISAGHYETEKVVLRPWIDRLQKVTDDVQYQLAHADASPYTRRLEE